MDGYTEVGGGFPVTVGRSVNVASEGRVGLTGRVTLSQPATLRLRGEYIHRFDRLDGGVGFTLNGVGFGGVAGLRAVDRDHARLGADLDYRIGSAGVLSLSANQMIGNSEGNPVSVSAGLHFKF